jgi:hypothetical protein
MSLIPKAIELAFVVTADSGGFAGTEQAQSALRVWERFRRHRPLGDTPLRRYEELGCVALLHGVLGDRRITDAQLRQDFGDYVARSIGRIGEGAVPAAVDELDLQLIMIIIRFDAIAFAPSSFDPDEFAGRLNELAADCLPLIELQFPDLAREIRFVLDDLREEPGSHCGTSRGLR